MEIVRLRMRHDLRVETAQLLNSEWPRSLAARLINLEEGEGVLPCSLVLLHNDQEVVGHVRLHAVSGRSHAVLLESLLVSREWRGRGLGAKLMSAAEEYAVGLDFHTIHLSTHDKQDFYRHLGYEDGPPTSALRDCVARLNKKQQVEVLVSTHPSIIPPPPPPPPPPLPPSPTCTQRHTLTWMKKNL
ncbi:N-alpha-acetyltransferase 80 [Geodia barretti]|uniref:N-alpha-acetyltransferase 80 n=1 Tax=Geodia barretti TaxID=519541 RepID=A0AA35S822_GEOBA|nr:N-alpha-acetyltransferase 80 [Geodia barretti]